MAIFSGVWLNISGVLPHTKATRFQATMDGQLFISREEHFLG